MKQICSVIYGREPELAKGVFINWKWIVYYTAMLGMTLKGMWAQKPNLTLNHATIKLWFLNPDDNHTI